MKKIIVTFLFIACASVLSLVNAANYTGNLIVKADSKEVVNQQSTVTATLNGNNAELKIDSFSFTGIPVSMKITLNCVCEDGNLKQPATLIIEPALVISMFLGQVELKTLSGTLNGNQCTLDMSVYSPKLGQNIQILFN